jgi:hypothetical protein
VEVLGFEIEGEGIGEQCVEHAGKVLYIFWREPVWDEEPDGFGLFYMALWRHSRTLLAGDALR